MITLITVDLLKQSRRNVTNKYKAAVTLCQLHCTRPSCVLVTRQRHIDVSVINTIYSSVARYHGTTAAPRYHFSTVPVPSALWYYLVPQYHNYRGSSARYCPILTRSNEHLLDCIVFGLKIAIFGLSSVVHC